MKTRLDVLLTERGLADSREKAKTLIMSGIVYVNSQKEDKPGTAFDPDTSVIEVRGNPIPYVSRGGLKLEKALRVFDIDLTGKVALDIGASTGGFTDCMLQNGAARVISVDVGYGQLDWKLRNDERVRCLEKTNFRYITFSDIGEYVDFATSDVSFISLNKIFKPAAELLKPQGAMVALIKPQFEAGRDKVGKKGVVRDPGVHMEVIESVCMDACGAGFYIRGLDYSPIRGPEGNIEYLLYMSKSDDGATDQVCNTVEIRHIVEAAHNELER